MENASNSSSILWLLGLVEMEEQKYFYCATSIIIYITTVLLTFMVVFIIANEESMQEPMYILICILTLSGLFGSSSFLPKLTIDFLISSKTISREACLIQSFCITAFAYFEISTLTIMAYDRYLAVCHPLQYSMLMTNDKALKLIGGSLIFTFAAVLTTVLLSARLPLCGTQIKNIFCDNMSIFVLSCVDTSVNNIYGTTIWVIFFTVTMVIIIYCYLKIFIICLTISSHERRKSFHTLVTHLLSFSIFLVGVLFVFIRYRLGTNQLPLTAHIVLSVNSLVFPPLINPVIYGIRTQTLKTRILHHLQNCILAKIV
ncbi:olfactory receptor 51G2-like [Pelobates fuscus]|uniref:olfactory receptor 51G2-like n=1 Tax=Pelobates fuscus TaxID=191477 RepID=UPI002FE45FC5